MHNTPKYMGQEAAIIIRIGLDGDYFVRIIADQSAEEEIVRRRLEAARPLIEQLQTIFTVEQFKNQDLR